jgi:hypothetical protein
MTSVGPMTETFFDRTGCFSPIRSAGDAAEPALSESLLNIAFLLFRTAPALAETLTDSRD